MIKFRLLNENIKIKINEINLKNDANFFILNLNLFFIFIFIYYYFLFCIFQETKIWYRPQIYSQKLTYFQI